MLHVALGLAVFPKNLRGRETEAVASLIRDEGKNQALERTSSFLCPVPPYLFSYVVDYCGGNKKSLYVCIPGDRAAWRQVHREVFRCASTEKCWSLVQPLSVPGPLPGACSGTRPSASFPLCKHVEQAPVGRSSHPFRQKYLLLKCWVCSWLKLFREFAVTETRVCLFFARYGNRLVKNGDLLFVTGTARGSQFVSWSLQKQSRDLQLEILALIYCSRCPDTAFYPETRVNRPAKM